MISHRYPNGFTLIELLIVTAIIAILAAIAIPNFLEAQTRSKVSQVHNDLRTLALALEVYHADYNGYPLFMQPAGEMIFPISRRMVPLSTPIAYLTILPPRDPFKDRRFTGDVDTYDYADAESFHRKGDSEPSYRTRGADWRLCSAGPDLFNTWGGPLSINPPGNPGCDYDPTNGTTSKGDIVRVGAQSRYGGNYMYPNSLY